MTKPLSLLVLVVLGLSGCANEERSIGRAATLMDDDRDVAIQAPSFSAGALSLNSTLPILSQFQLSYGYARPISIQGAGEARQPLEPATADARYSRQREIGISYRQYNVWWSELEGAVPSSSVPMNCPSGFHLVPKNESERAQLGFNRYHCINSPMLAKWDFLFARDAAYGMQSGIVVWSTPKFYRYEKCEGFGFGGNHLLDPCVPRDDAMADYEDYFTLLASRYNGGPLGKIGHYIIWNENASDDWFDYTPVVKKGDLSKAGIKAKLDKYADMMKRAHDVIARHARGVMFYASTDQLWEPKIHPGHMGTRQFLEGLWTRLGTSMSWSVAVHPYGDPAGAAPSGRYTFNNLQMVHDFQVQKLRDRGVTSPQEYPQSYLIASEQGHPLSEGGRPGQARFICLAHDKAMKVNSILAVAHNYFQSVEPQEVQPGGESGQGAFFGLIPYAIPDSLEGYETTATGQAFLATSTQNWGQNNNHYCCQKHQVGCLNQPPPPNGDKKVVGVVDGVFFERDRAYLQGWTCARGIAQPIKVRISRKGSSHAQKLVTEFVAEAASEDPVRAECRVNTGNYRFRFELSKELRAAYAGQTLVIEGRSPVDQSLAPLMRSGQFTIPK